MSPKSFWGKEGHSEVPFHWCRDSDEALPLTLLFLQEAELLWESSLPDPPPRAHRPFPQSIVFLPNIGLQFGKSPLHGWLKCPFGTWEVTIDCPTSPRAPLGQGHPQP